MVRKKSTKKITRKQTRKPRKPKNEPHVFGNLKIPKDAIIKDGALVDETKYYTSND